MPPDLNFLNCDFPSDWQDDVRMNFLFGTFRDRCVNPEGYDSKMIFWINTIEHLCTKANSPVVSLLKLCLALERKNRQPMCLDVVLENMLKQKKIISLEEFNQLNGEKGWLSWGYSVLVQKPIFWGLSSVQSLLTSGKKSDTYVVLSAVKNLASNVANRYKELIGVKWTDSAVFLEHLKQECKDFCTDYNFQLALIHLQKEKEAYVYEEFGEKVVKFRKKDEQHVQPPSELDRGILSLKRAQDTISADIDIFEENIQSCQKEVKEYLKSGNKSKAMLFLKKKKRLEDAIQKKTVALDNVENLLTRLRNAGSEKMVLDAYRIGVKAMKKNTSSDFDLDTIDDVMADVKEAMEDYSEVQNTLARSVTGEEDDLEAELAELLAGEEQSQKELLKRKQTPDPDEELMKRLDALRAPPLDTPPVKKPTLTKPIRAP